PLVQSLRHPMVVRDRRLQERAGLPGLPLREALADALDARSRHARPSAPGPLTLAQPRSLRRMTRPTGDVRSVQRLALPPGHDARWIADEYLRWLPGRLRFLLRVEVTRARGEGRPAPILCRFRVRFVRRPLIEL